MIDKAPKRRGTGVKVTFSIPVEWLPKKVCVVGDFNGWDHTANPLRKRGSVKTATLELERGRTYAFRYLDEDGRWHDDPAADGVEPSAAGGTNCILDLRDPEPEPEPGV